MCAPCKVNVRCQAACASTVHANSSLCKSGQATVLVTVRPPSCGLRKASQPSPWKYVLRLARASWSSGNVHCTPCTGPQVERGRQKQVHTSWPANWLARAVREQQTGRPRMVLVTAVKKACWQTGCLWGCLPPDLGLSISPALLCIPLKSSPPCLPTRERSPLKNYGAKHNPYVHVVKEQSQAKPREQSKVLSSNCTQSDQTEY